MRKFRHGLIEGALTSRVPGSASPSPRRIHDAESATRSAFERARAPTSLEPAQPIGVSVEPSRYAGRNRAQPCPMLEIAGQMGEKKMELRLRDSSEDLNRRAGEELEGDHSRGGIAGKSEEILPLRLAKYQRLARLDQHAIEVELLAPEFRQDLLDQIVFCPQRRHLESNSRSALVEPTSDQVRESLRA